MLDTEAAAIRKLYGEGKEAEADTLIEELDGVNRAIQEQGLVTRGEEPQTEPEAEMQPEAEAVTEETTTEYELDEETLVRIAEKVRESLPPPAEAPDLAPLETALRDVGAKLAALGTRLSELERTDEEKRQTWVADLPAKNRINVTYRPREEHAAEAQNAPPSFAEVAAQTVAQIEH